MIGREVPDPATSGSRPNVSLFVGPVAGVLLFIVAILEGALLASRHAVPKAWVWPLLLGLASVAGSWFSIGRNGWMGVWLLLTASLVSIAIGWGNPLSAEQAEHVFAIRHPGWPPPIRCRSGHQELGGLFEKVYVCDTGDTFDVQHDGLPVAVNDKGIVEEWP